MSDVVIEIDKCLYRVSEFNNFEIVVDFYNDIEFEEFMNDNAIATDKNDYTIYHIGSDKIIEIKGARVVSMLIDGYDLKASIMYDAYVFADKYNTDRKYGFI